MTPVWPHPSGGWGSRVGGWVRTSGPLPQTGGWGAPWVGLAGQRPSPNSFPKGFWPILGRFWVVGLTPQGGGGGARMGGFSKKKKWTGGFEPEKKCPHPGSFNKSIHGVQKYVPSASKTNCPVRVSKYSESKNIIITGIFLRKK